MLIKFMFSNFMSYRDATLLDMTSNSSKDHEDNLLTFGKDRFLPTVAIYGANASGKTNINKAFSYAINYVKRSNYISINEPTGITPFLLDDESKIKPSSFEFEYVFKGVKYRYGFSVSSKEIIDEYLYVYNSSKPSLVFNRHDVNKYDIPVLLKKELEPIATRNAPNKLFLSTATSWNAKPTKDAYLWFAEDIHVIDSTGAQNKFLNALENDEDSSLKSFIINLMRNVDINISDFDYRIEKGDPSKIILPPGLNLDDSVLENLKEWELNTRHKIITNNVQKEYTLPLLMESRGTINAFFLAPSFKSALEEGMTIVIDEIDSGLHPSIVQYLVSLFNDSNNNINGAQLIFNTHDISLLDLDIFRRDQIYFTEKRYDTATSELYSLASFAPRKTENIQKGYLQGRYGAIPNISVGGIDFNNAKQ